MKNTKLVDDTILSVNTEAKLHMLLTMKTVKTRVLIATPGKQNL